MTRNTSRGFLLPFVALLIALTGCTISDVPVGDEDEARKIAEQYYAMLQSGDLTKAATFYEPDQRGHWEMFLQKQAQEMGPMTSHSFKSKTVNTVFSGKFYIFQVGTKYGENSADEILTLFLKVGEQNIHIVSHKINPAGKRAG